MRTEFTYPNAFLRHGHGGFERRSASAMKEHHATNAAPLRDGDRVDSARRSLTLFAIPKPFHGHIGMIQRNAIQSWMRMDPPCEIILCGDEDGTAEVAAELNVRHLPDLARNEFGTPFLHTVFDRVRRMASGELLAYVNADIMLLSDFSRAVAAINWPSFVMVGRRWDIDVTAQCDFSNPCWSEDLEKRLAIEGRPHSLWGIDYFVFPRDGVLERLPPFVVGRPGWDNWMIYHARRNNVPVIDASPMARVVHQNHDYSHVPMRTGERWTGPEARRQVQLLYDLMNGSTVRFAIADATHALTSEGAKRIRSLRSLRRRWETLSALHPRMKPVVTLLHPFVFCIDLLWRRLHREQN